MPRFPAKISDCAKNAKPQLSDVEVDSQKKLSAKQIKAHQELYDCYVASESYYRKIRRINLGKRRK